MWLDIVTEDGAGGETAFQEEGLGRGRSGKGRLTSRPAVVPGSLRVWGEPKSGGSLHSVRGKTMWGGGA